MRLRIMCSTETLQNVIKDNKGLVLRKVDDFEYTQQLFHVVDVEFKAGDLNLTTFLAKKEIMLVDKDNENIM